MSTPRRRIWLFLLLAAGSWFVFAGGRKEAFSQPAPVPGLEAEPPADQAPPIPVTWDDFIRPWRDFHPSNFPIIARMLCAFLLATALSAAIAYHPRSYGKARSLSEVESPKTYIMYALAGALFGQIFKIDRFLGLVLFGLGGLMRFRTDVGAAKDTGRVIVVTCIGLCCGLLRYDIAAVSTGFAYFLIAALEGGTAYKVTVKGLTEETLLKSAGAYRHLLDEQGCRILNEKKNFVKHQASFVFRAPRGIDREDLEQIFEESIPSELKGAADWQSS